MPLPETIDGYSVLELIGRGGSGRVYRVTDRQGNVRALKTWRDHDGMTAMEEQRFLREFNVASGLVHPNIVQVYGWGRVEGTPYFSMEYVEGGHLRDYIARHGGAGLHWLQDADLREQLFTVVSGVLSGLAYIHAHRIVHRDLKPENILVTDEGVPKIMDFGLARNLESSVRLTTENTLLGTIAYMSPEQVASAEVDPRSDLYSLGVLIYEWLMGRLPYDARDVGALLGSILMQAPPALHDVSPLVSVSLSRFVSRLLEKEPGRRPVTADEALGAWHQACRGLADSASEPLPAPTLPVAPALYEPVFVGRETEMALLTGLLDRIQQSRMAVVVLNGESGVGKSRMALELTRIAALRGVPSITVRCYEDVDVPYELFLPLLRYLVRQPLSREMEEYIESVRPVLSALLPELVSEGQAPAESDKYRLLQTVSRLLDMVRNVRPVLFIFDDLQWADARSLELLGYLVRESRQSKQSLRYQIGALLMYREEEVTADHPLMSFLGTLPGTEVMGHIRLTRLTAEATERMALSMLGGRPLPPGLLDLLVREAEGNAFFVGEFLKALLQEGILTLREGEWVLESQAMFRWGPRVDSGGVPVPITVRDVIRRRLRRLPQTAWDTLRLCAVLGRDVPYELLTRCSSLPEEDLLSSIELLLSEKILDENRSRGSLAFYHPQIREVVLEDMPEARRRSLHLRAARAMEEYARGDVSRYLFDLAHHYTQGRDLTQAAHYLVLAADQAKAAFAYDHALATLQELEKLAQEDGGMDAGLLLDVRRQKAHVTLLCGDFKGAVRLYSELAEQVSGTARADVLRNLGRAWDFLGEHDRAYDSYVRALETLGEKVKVREFRTLLEAVRNFDRPGKEQRLTPSETERVRELRKIYDLMVQSYYFATLDDRRLLGTELAMRQVRASLALGQINDVAQAWLSAGFMLLHLSSHLTWKMVAAVGTDARQELLRLGRGYLEKSLSCLPRLPDAPLKARILREVGFNYLGIGEVRAALPLLEESLSLCQRVNDVLGLPQTATMASMAHQLQGRLDRAEEEAELGLACARTLQNATMGVFLSLRTFRCAMSRYAVEAAHEWLSQARRQALPSWSPKAYQLLRMQAAEADLMRVEGRLDQAVLILEQNRHVFRQTGLSMYDCLSNDVETGMAWLDWLEADGPREDGLRACEAIARDARSLSHGPLLKALSLMLLGRLRAVQGRPEEAHRRLSRSIQLLRDAGADALLARGLIEAGRALKNDGWLSQGRDMARQMGFELLARRADGMTCSVF